MKQISTERALAYYRSHRRENFAASQRIEGIHSPATRLDCREPLPTKEQLRKKYAVRQPAR